MNGLRRTLLVVYSMLLIAAAAGLIALTWNDDRKLDLSLGDFNLQAFVAASDNARIAATAVLAIVALIGVVSILLAFQRGERVSRGMVRLRQADGGTVEVSPSTLEGILRDDLERLSMVREATPKVRVSGGAVESDIAVTIEQGASIAQVTNTIAQATAQTLREQVGATTIRRPNIRINYDETA